MKYAIESKQLVKQFGAFRAVDGMDLRLESGKISALLGPNGAGKTTAISMMLGMLKPTSGEIRVLGQLAGSPELRERVGAMMQDARAADGLTVREVLQLLRSYYRNPLPLDRLLDVSGLHGEAMKRASSLSGGQRRRLAFAQSLAGNPQLLLLDEPTVGMDVEARIRFWETIRELADQGTTVLLTTHHLEEADNVADHIAVLAAGRIIAEGTPGELKVKASLRTVSFRAASMPHEHELLQLPGVEKVDSRGSRIRLYVRNADLVLPELLRTGWGVTDIEVQSASLEDAFRSITEKPLAQKLAHS
ncbi:ABC transporter ATP-binding protein [Paenibacillus sp. IB182363]|uniref:ABC transporter ATP-binding protein n=1 Tax=Paenibacillus oceani TaxID=2772510 RepID=A0A927C5N9_9BACL|nr:ABC transporter ATP-binding protein [Paenibacillus oceani]MBD2860397.1 ABC transporter ATP-binding protein [Paenibacillus oceani]